MKKSLLTLIAIVGLSVPLSAHQLWLEREGSVMNAYFGHWPNFKEKEEGERLMAVAGYMSIHTRQLDMIMQDPSQVDARRAEMLAHCRALFRGEPLTPAVDSPSQEAR